jgi:hypothetical protein
MKSVHQKGNICTYNSTDVGTMADSFNFFVSAGWLVEAIKILDQYSNHVGLSQR